MKRTALIITTLAAAMMINALPAFSADEYGSTIGGEVKATVPKDECLLVAKNCGDNVDSYQQRIGRLEREIKKGTDVYTPEELNMLNRKLDEENRLFDALSAGS